MQNNLSPKQYKKENSQKNISCSNTVPCRPMKRQLPLWGGGLFYQDHLLRSKQRNTLLHCHCLKRVRTSMGISKSSQCQCQSGDPGSQDFFPGNKAPTCILVRKFTEILRQGPFCVSNIEEKSDSLWKASIDADPGFHGNCAPITRKSQGQKCISRKTKIKPLQESETRIQDIWFREPRALKWITLGEPWFQL